MGLFQRKSSLKQAAVLQGAVDVHSHILYGLDDGVPTWEDAQVLLARLEEEGVQTLWFTPHIMEDCPNRTADLKARFEELKARYQGRLRVELAAEYMMDGLLQQRLSEKDLLPHSTTCLLVETSFVNPPYEFWQTLERIKSAGYYPLLAHPERYFYMEKKDYRRLQEMGVRLQLNLPSLAGMYGKEVTARAKWLLEHDYYHCFGSDTHSLRQWEYALEARIPASLMPRLERIKNGL